MIFALFLPYRTQPSSKIDAGSKNPFVKFF
jgi:hypothetical protein